MIDFIKSVIINLDLDELKDNKFLDFGTEVNLNTGELGVFQNAYYYGLEFKIYNPTIANPKGRLTIEGSLHKYWNEGNQNHNDFTINDLKLVLNDIYLKFGIKASNLSITQLEIGINFVPPVSTVSIITSCLLHKTELFKSIYTRGKGNYKQVRHGNYFVKIYDKRLHAMNKGYNISKEIMRFEIKFRKQKLNVILNKKGEITLEDIIQFGLINFKPVLIKEWNNILFYDFTSLDKTQYEERYSNPNFWLKLKSNNFKYHRTNLNKIINSNPQNLKQIMKEIIGNKIDLLNHQTTRIRPLLYSSKKGSMKLVEVGSVCVEKEYKKLKHFTI